MRILITGGSGFIGSNLVRKLLREGHRVVNLDKLTYASEFTGCSDFESQPKYFLERVDLAATEKSLAELFNKHQPNAVIHLAAESHVDRSIEGPEAFIQSNIVGTYRLLQAGLVYWHSLPDETADARGEQPSKQTFRFVHVSTDEVYGSLNDGETPFDEQSRYLPNSPYSASKAASDHLVRAWQVTYGLPTITVHSSNAYGPAQHPEKLIPRVIEKCVCREPIPVYGNGANRRDWLHVEDLCGGLLSVVQRGRAGEVYNFGGNYELRNIDLVKQLCALMDRLRPSADAFHHERLITFVADRAGHDYRYASDISKVREELGWSPRIDFVSGLEQTVHWYLERIASKATS